MTIAINVHRDALATISRLFQARQYKTVAEWYRVTAGLRPSDGIQFVKPLDKLTAPLLDAGLIRRHAGRSTRYYVPRSLAFVSVEPDLEGTP